MERSLNPLGVASVATEGREGADVARTAVKTKPQDRPPMLEGWNLLERALERALASLDTDASLTDIERAAAKTALAAALASELRDAVLRVPPQAEPQAEMFSFAPAAVRASPVSRDRPGYFRPPAEAIGLCGGGYGVKDCAEASPTGGHAAWLRVA